MSWSCLWVSIKISTMESLLQWAHEQGVTGLLPSASSKLTVSYFPDDGGCSRCTCCTRSARAQTRAGGTTCSSYRAATARWCGLAHTRRRCCSSPLRSPWPSARWRAASPRGRRHGRCCSPCQACGPSTGRWPPGSGRGPRCPRAPWPCRATVRARCAPWPTSSTTRHRRHHTHPVRRALCSCRLSRKHMRVLLCYGTYTNLQLLDIYGFLLTNAPSTSSDATRLPVQLLVPRDIRHLSTLQATPSCRGECRGGGGLPTASGGTCPSDGCQCLHHHDQDAAQRRGQDDDPCAGAGVAAGGRSAGAAVGASSSLLMTRNAPCAATASTTGCFSVHGPRENGPDMTPPATYAIIPIIAADMGSDRASTACRVGTLWGTAQCRLAAPVGTSTGASSGSSFASCAEDGGRAHGLCDAHADVRADGGPTAMDPQEASPSMSTLTAAPTPARMGLPTPTPARATASTTTAPQEASPSPATPVPLAGPAARVVATRRAQARQGSGAARPAHADPANARQGTVVASGKTVPVTVFASGQLAWESLVSLRAAAEELRASLRNEPRSGGMGHAVAPPHGNKGPSQSQRAHGIADSRCSDGHARVWKGRDHGHTAPQEPGASGQQPRGEDDVITLDGDISSLEGEAIVFYSVRHACEAALDAMPTSVKEDDVLLARIGRQLAELERAQGAQGSVPDELAEGQARRAMCPATDAMSPVTDAMSPATDASGEPREDKASCQLGTRGPLGEAGAGVEGEHRHSNPRGMGEWTQEEGCGQTPAASAASACSPASMRELDGNDCQPSAPEPPRQPHQSSTGAGEELSGGAGSIIATFEAGVAATAPTGKLLLQHLERCQLAVMWRASYKRNLVECVGMCGKYLRALQVLMALEGARRQDKVAVGGQSKAGKGQVYRGRSTRSEPVRTVEPT
eukprot:jgi/Mesvir1/28005/Mv20196-RA.2